jgi:DNA-binding transcriptional LysR family regulator
MAENRPEMGDVGAFLAVARHGGFREAARATDSSSSALSDAVRRLETQLGVRLLNRTTRSVVPTEAGRGLMERASPAFSEINAALEHVRSLRGRPAGHLKLNVPSISSPRAAMPVSDMTSGWSRI